MNKKRTYFLQSICRNILEIRFSGSFQKMWGGQRESPSFSELENKAKPGRPTVYRKVQNCVYQLIESRGGIVRVSTVVKSEFTQPKDDIFCSSSILFEKVKEKFDMRCNENPSYIFLEKELRGLSPNFHIHVSVSDLYIPRIGPHNFLPQNRHTSLGNI